MAKKKAVTPQEPAFEDRLARLEKIVERLESGEAGLDESLRLYGEGAELVKACRTTLETAEQKIARLTEEAGGDLKEEPLEVDEAKEPK
jgi:exodeoxyribonuclease VII small subunit